MWEPRRLTTLWASTACYRDSFTFTFVAVVVVIVVVVVVVTVIKEKKCCKQWECTVYNISGNVLN
jgi:hypothetical protein